MKASSHSQEATPSACSNCAALQLGSQHLCGEPLTILTTGVQGDRRLCQRRHPQRRVRTYSLGLRLGPVAGSWWDLHPHFHVHSPLMTFVILFVGSFVCLFVCLRVCLFMCCLLACPISCTPHNTCTLLAYQGSLTSTIFRRHKLQQNVCSGHHH